MTPTFNRRLFGAGALARQIYNGSAEIASVSVENTVEPQDQIDRCLSTGNTVVVITGNVSN